MRCRGKALLLALSLWLAVPVPPVAADAGLAACYGETIDVSLIGLKPSGDSDGAVTFRLPSGHDWHIRLSGNRALHELPCQAEPVAVQTVYGHELTTGSRAPDGFPQYLLSLIITGGRERNTMSRLDTGRLGLIDQNGVPLGYGFVGYLSGPPATEQYAPHVGLYRFPPNHGSPLGEPVLRRCNRWICSGSYGFLDKLYVTYVFRNELVPLTDWVAQDAGLQALINSWIEIEGE